MGKAKLRAMLARDGLALSVSTVGRILSKAIADGRIKPASFCEGRAKPKRRRRFDDAWANRWRHGDRAKAPGEMLQIDHMTYSRDGRALKEFRAVCPVTKFMAARVFSRATAGNAKRFLEAVLEAMPFPVRSIQVDGGSEFMADFERACEAMGIPLHVLPPRRPQWRRQPAQGRGVERANRSRVLEPLRRTPHRRRRRPKARPARVLPQLPAAALGAGLPNPKRVPCRDRGCCLIRQAKSSEMS